jgi:IS6 family transposase
VRWYCRYALSCRDVRDLLAERGVAVDASSVHRWVRKLRPGIARRMTKHRTWPGTCWHVDETYLRVGGRWCYLWRAIDRKGQVIDFRLTARRDLKASRAFFRRARDAARCFQPSAITTGKAHEPQAHHRGGQPPCAARRGDRARHLEGANNRIESDHAALKRITTPMRGFQSLSSAKATLRGIEAVHAIRRSQIHSPPSGITCEIRVLHGLFGIAA